MSVKTPVRFTTNLDCCKRMMGQNSGLPIESINPMVGDLVRVYHDSDFHLYLKVVRRKWDLVNGATPELVCELHLPDYFPTIGDLEAAMRKRNFHW